MDASDHYAGEHTIPTDDGFVLARVTAYLIRRNLAVMLQLAETKAKQSAVLREARELGFSKNELRAVM